MSKYNAKREKIVKKTVSHEGGLAYTQTPERELVAILSTGIQNSFYETENDREKRLHGLIDKIAKKDKKFAAQALVYARSVFGQRSVTHVGAVNLLPHLAGDPLAKRFFSKRNRKENIGGIIYRLDDMAEILSYYLLRNGEDAPIPNSIKKGFKDAIEHADKYQIAKYQMRSRGVSLVDIVNLVHPKETKIQGFVDVPFETYVKAVAGTKWEGKIIDSKDGNYRISTLRALVLGLLKQFNTVEDKNTESGKVVAEKVKSGEITKEQAVVELTEAKADNFSTLISTKKIGYLALLRNLRNILKTGDSKVIEDACELLQNKEMIKKSLVWPHQIDLALEIMLLENHGQDLKKVSSALSAAYELSIPNLEKLLPPGETAVVFDTSGSMIGGMRWGSPIQILVNGRPTGIDKSPADKAALIAATFAKGTGARVYHFGADAAEIVGWNPNDSINTLKKEFQSHNGECGHSTYPEAAFNLFSDQNKQYDRIVIITDEQGHGNLEAGIAKYSKRFGTPYIYVINVCGYSNTALKTGKKTLNIQGYSSDIYTKISELEIDVNAVIKAIREIEI